MERVRVLTGHASLEVEGGQSSGESFRESFVEFGGSGGRRGGALAQRAVSEVLSQSCAGCHRGGRAGSCRKRSLLLHLFHLLWMR